jgi:cell division septum initiation protein DivIVA
MAILSKSGAAELAGVTPGAITRALERGKLVETADRRIDTAHPTNAAWLADRIAGDPAPDADAIRAEIRSLSGIADKTALEIEKLRQDIRVGLERERTMQIKRLQLAGDLVPRDLVAQAWARFAVAYRAAHAQFPSRWAPQVAAAARTDGEAGARVKLAEAIDELMLQVAQNLEREEITK